MRQDDAAMLEAGFWSDRLRPQLIKHCQALEMRHHFERVENRVADGTPDVEYCIAGQCGHIELKFAPRHPLLPTVQVLGSKGRDGMRRSQIVWASRRTWAGGRAWCMVGTPEESWLLDLRRFSPQLMDTIGGATTADLDRLACWRATAHGWAALPPALCK